MTIGLSPTGLQVDPGVTDCTISGNSGGGGVFNSGTVNLTACTLSGNSDSLTKYPGGLYDRGSATAALTDTIVAGNTNPGGASDIGDPVNVSGSHNLVGTGGSGGW